MARTVRWTETATHDVEEAADFIARDSRYYAAALVRDARAVARSLRTLAERGRVVPEARSSNVREIPVKSYRLIYEVSPDRVSVLAFVHGSRDLPALWQRREGTADPEA
ncbi:MAG TPA: type II toxin-antitoxin system RelE/ParE family toxin [Thermoanaerobaculia bacterium]|nr:type II toxin-antitoxin system RelE/ParE family toxin [Thermoanaerobaculia bacterium]